MAYIIDNKYLPAKGDVRTREIKYVLKCDQYDASGADEHAALSFMYQHALRVYQRDYYLQNIQIEQLTETLPLVFEATTFYEYNPPGTLEWEFETTGQSVNVKYSIETIAGRGSGGGIVPPNYQRAVNVTAEGVDGVDIFSPVSTFSLTWTNVFSYFTRERLIAWSQLVSTVNCTPFFGYPPGEVLFLGYSGKLATATDEFTPMTSQLRFSFQRSVGSYYANNTAIVVPGNTSSVEKLGWDYIWMTYTKNKAPAIGTGSLAAPVDRIMNAAYVERVYQYRNFALWFGFGAGPVIGPAGQETFPRCI